MLRDFERRDQAAVRELILSGMRDRWGDRYDDAANPDADDMWSAYVVGGGVVVVGEVDGAVVATGTLVAEPDGGGRIVRMAVARSHRRRGLGRAVVAALVERAAARGLDPLRVTTDTPWLDAVALYAACGFAVVGRDEEATHFSLRIAPG